MNLTIETEQEEDGRWIAEVPELTGVLAYGPRARRQWRKHKCSRSASSPSSWSMARRGLSPFRCPSRRNEPLSFEQGAARARGAAAHRVGGQEAVRVTSDAVAQRLGRTSCSPFTMTTNWGLSCWHASPSARA